MKKLIHSEQDIGYQQVFHSDSEGNLAIQTVQDVTDVVEENKRLFNATEKSTPWGEGQRVASIPLSIYYSKEFQEIRKDQKKLRAWLNDSANAAFRTRAGKV